MLRFSLCHLIVWISSDMSVFEFRTRVSYDDIDENMCLTLRGAMGLMQEAAIIHSDMVGYSIYDTPRTHVLWMLIHWRIRLTGKAMWNEELTVKTWPRTFERATSERDFEIVDAGGKQIAIGESLWVLVNADTGRITRITPEISKAYDLTDHKVFDDELRDPAQGEGTITYACNVLRRDIDTNHHVNNRVYLDYAMEALPEDMELGALHEISVRYRRQLFLGQPVDCFYRKDGDCHIVDICSEDGKVLNCTVMMQ